MKRSLARVVRVWMLVSVWGALGGPAALASATQATALIAPPGAATAANVALASPPPKSGLVDHTGARLGLDELHFVDDSGAHVSLGKYFDSGRPVVLAPIYYGCTGVCSALLGTLIDALKTLPLEPGRAFELVAVSIDPDETWQLARDKKAALLKQYGRTGTEAGWHFLTGRVEDVARLTDELGFGFERQAAGGAPSLLRHPSALYVLTPQGVVSSTLGGVAVSRKLLRVSLVQAGGGQLGNFFDRLSSLCTSYLPHRGWLNSPIRWIGFLSVLLGLGLWSATQALLKWRFGKSRNNPGFIGINRSTWASSNS